jgi:hypothetical protein
MKNKINIVELLKDCPRGMELDCLVYEDVYFDYVDELNIIHCYVQFETYTTSLLFDKHGAYGGNIKSKCVIFPKGKKTWVGFHRPFVEGDIVSTESGMYIGIVKSTEDDHECRTFCSVHDKKDFHVGKELYFSRLATEEEKQIMFALIKANDYHWNEATKTLEKLHKFKVGNKIRHKESGIHCTLGEYAEGISAYRTNIGLSITPTDMEHWELIPDKPYFKIGDKIRHKKNTTRIKTIDHIYSDCYALYDSYLLYFKEQDEWELVPDKFDINTLKPFESKVLVRHHKTGIWIPAIFGGYDIPNLSYYTVGGTWWQYCIPYKDNEHLLGKTDDCDDFYKTWK